MNILARHPRSYPQERAFVFDVVLSEGIGIPWVSIPEDRPDVELSLDDTTTDRIVLADTVFSHPEQSWPDCLRLPDAPLPMLRGDWIRDAIGADDVPVLFGRPETSGAWVEAQGDALRLGVDIFGAVFVLLTRLEELGDVARDAHGRFPARASLAHRLGFLDRPLADEYVELLRGLVNRVFPGVTSTRPAYGEDLSHDIDFVDGRRLGVRGAIRASARDLITNRAPRVAGRRLASLPLRPIVGPRCDVFNTFAELMDLSEEHGRKSTFFFIAGRTPGGIFDDNYEIDEPWVRKVMRSIDQRGHEIGLHGSYNSYASQPQLVKELDALRGVLREEGIQTDPIGCRQHYLRFEPATTWPSQADAGLAYDATLGFADAPGFRAGTCRAFPVFDVAARRRIPLRERPLTVMDTTILDPAYLGLTSDDAVRTVERLKASCRRVGGTFSLLWHNTMLVTPTQQALYREILSC